MTATTMAATPPPPLRLIDRTNPVTRLAAVIVLTTPLLLTLDWVSAAVAVVAELMAFMAAGISLGVIARRTWPVLASAPIAGISMLLYGRPSGEEYWSFWLARVTEGSVELAVAVTLRVLAIGIPVVVLFLRVDPVEVADGLAQVARLPSRFVIGALAGVRMIGLLRDDWDAMALSRRARGLGDSGVVRRAATMAFALLVLAIRRGAKLATAMEARGFGSEPPRTFARPSHVGAPDAALLVLAAAIAAAAVAAAVFAGAFQPVWV